MDISINPIYPVKITKQKRDQGQGKKRHAPQNFWNAMENTTSVEAHAAPAPARTIQPPAEQEGLLAHMQNGLAGQNGGVNPAMASSSLFWRINRL